MVFGIHKLFVNYSFEIWYLVFVRLRLWPNGWSLRQASEQKFCENGQNPRQKLSKLTLRIAFLPD